MSFEPFFQFPLGEGGRSMRAANKDGSCHFACMYSCSFSGQMVSLLWERFLIPTVIDMPWYDIRLVIIQDGRKEGKPRHSPSWWHSLAFSGGSQGVPISNPDPFWPEGQNADVWINLIHTMDSNSAVQQIIPQSVDTSFLYILLGPGNLDLFAWGNNWPLTQREQNLRLFPSASLSAVKRSKQE